VCPVSSTLRVSGAPPPCPTRRSSDLCTRRTVAVNDPRASASRLDRRNRRLGAGPERLRQRRPARSAHVLRGLSSSVAQLLRPFRSEEHTSELQSRENLVCRLLLEKKH